ncbi:hypothetical protein FJV41_22190 [Myxococcus llanfairpwllgwyngyllgogerychwyrndrobwllllantysiliogogogochensis]|uniref:Uncharacterized protein n=1 Tax=Myxococcus llanfairpwllgwyngyllgogerychwyrndrobwllllantysiliogogogochensis TaxID=2590453 RepID=A0A540WXN0_9BACT|nr:hypothetical protein [Myxococcus llanfairpwllgwyngyllgogerychwyrndrobwllllantysiliogogogochensis]TQF13758.1 hypothetical protein FJV41_22190 [Myxococcus llanfairpwllgwyngyllgogerychwyrndrobwllllantysiliogogogochensis]
MLAKEEYVEVEWRDRTLLMTCVVCSGSLMCVAVSKKRWLSLVKNGERGEEWIVDVAATMGIGTLVIVDDPPDDFLGSVVPFEQTWVILPRRRWGEMEPLTVLNDSKRDALPKMRSLQPTGRAVGTFQEYRERLDSEVPGSC